ncbi:hypothetical protein K1719_002755 [Acacia pycnantha]|nr:hypothetical protein K1719_002755 [Acacia pycnantha]
MVDEAEDGEDRVLAEAHRLHGAGLSGNSTPRDCGCSRDAIQDGRLFDQRGRHRNFLPCEHDSLQKAAARRFRVMMMSLGLLVRTYALFLEERLECFRVLKYDVEVECLPKPAEIQEKNDENLTLSVCGIYDVV